MYTSRERKIVVGQTSKLPSAVALKGSDGRSNNRRHSSSRDVDPHRQEDRIEGELYYRNMNNASAGPSSKAKAGASQPSEATLKRKRGIFQKDLQHMMYGFGDDLNPLPETVALMEDIVVEYVTDLVHKAQDIGSRRGKLLTEDFLFLTRKDPPKFNRATELLSMNEELKQARKAFEVDEEKLASVDD